MKQPDLVCTECPLSECSEESLWCVFRLLTKPNAAQRQLIDNRVMIRKTSRARYDAKRYKENREELKAKSLDRYYKKRETELSHDDSAR